MPFGCVSSLRPLCGNCAAVGPNGVSFIETVTRLIALVLDYRNVPTDDYHKGRRMGCMLNLLVSGDDGAV